MEGKIRSGRGHALLPYPERFIVLGWNMVTKDRLLGNKDRIVVVQARNEQCSVV